MIWLVFALGAVCTIEGLVMALAPRRIEEVLAFLARLPVETRRGMGLATLALGVAMIWLARLAGL